MQTIIIDFEFTGLDNNFISDHEIVQMKALNVETGQKVCMCFGSDKEIGAHPFLSIREKKYNLPKFNKDLFLDCLKQVADLTDYVTEFIGFGVNQDIKMLAKYDIKLLITDLRQHVQLSEHEYRMATEGNSLECAYYILTDQLPSHKDHGDLAELDTIFEIYKLCEKLNQKEHYTIMPFGPYAGMPLSEYIVSNRRQADGYRFNNHDKLSDSLTHYIDEMEYAEREDFY